MFVLKSTFTREVEFWREKYFAEQERNRKREDELLNRVLVKNASFPVTEEDLEPYVAPLPPEPPAGLDDIRQQYDIWADEAGVSDAERERQWAIQKHEYATQLQ